jgi:hypothetical protein
MSNAANKTTNALWTETHSALCAGRWSQARALLDDLGRRSDNADCLLSIEQYCQLAGKSLPVGFDAVLADRIDLVNSKVGR